MQQDYSILVDKKDSDYWTTTLKRIRTCTCRHTHDTFKNYHILNNKMYKERKSRRKRCRSESLLSLLLFRHTNYKQCTT